MIEKDLTEFYTVNITCWKSGKEFKRYIKMTDSEANRFFGIGKSSDVKAQVSSKTETVDASKAKEVQS